MWIQYLEEEQVIYFQYNSCMPPGYENFNKIVEEIKTIITQQDGQFKKIIVDIRQNTDGDTTAFTSFTQTLKLFQDKYSFEVYGLIGNMTFSSVTIAAQDLRSYLHTTLIGEETGGNAKAFGNGLPQKLLNSLGSIVISAQYFHLADQEGGILPDIEVIRSFEEYEKAIDPVLESALN